MFYLCADVARQQIDFKPSTQKGVFDCSRLEYRVKRLVGGPTFQSLFKGVEKLKKRRNFRRGIAIRVRSLKGDRNKGTKFRRGIAIRVRSLEGELQ